MKIYRKKKKKLPVIYLWIIILVIIIGGIAIRLHFFFTNDNYRIRHIRYTVANIQQYNNVDMYTKITSYLSGESLRYRSLLGYGDIEDAIYETIPYINTISFVPQWPETVRATISFLDPLLVMQYHEKKWAIYSGGYSIPLFSWNTLGVSSKHIRLPIYLSGVNALSGVFFSTPFDKIYHDRLLLDSYINSGGFITYIPGWEKYVLVNGDYRYYFNAKKDMQMQIDTLLHLKQYYKDFPRLHQIDIGSLNYPIVQ